MTTLTNATFVDHLTHSIRYVIPEVVLVGVACVLLTLAAFRASRGLGLVLALSGVIGAAVVTVLVPEQAESFNPAYAPIDPSGAALFIRWLALVAAVIYLILGLTDVRSENATEYFACLLVVTAGVSLAGRANDLISVFLALELISIPTYVLLYLPIRTKAGLESAMKYFLLSVLASGVLLFGFSYLYGLTGSTNLPTLISTLTAAADSPPISTMSLVAMILTIAGLGFRIALVPFHFYAPDVYEGGPTGVVAQLAFLPKVAGFVVLARLLGVLNSHSNGIPFDTEHTLIPLTLWVIAVVTMSFGNLLALIQDNVKRLFAYSGIAHAGYMMIGVLVGCTLAGPSSEHSGMDAVLFYLVAYGLMTIGFFAVLTHLKSLNQEIENVDDLAGLGRSHPTSAVFLAIFLLSLIGLPLTAGFIGKFHLFLAAFEVPTETKLKSLYRVLTVIAVVNAAVAAVYYLRVIGVLFLRTPLKPVEPARGSYQLAAAMVCAVATLALGVYPQPLWNQVQSAAPLNAKAAVDMKTKPVD